MQTCRLCCFESRCHDPTPGSNLRIAVMKELMLASGFDSETLQRKLAEETEIARKRGLVASSEALNTTESEGSANAEYAEDTGSCVYKGEDEEEEVLVECPATERAVSEDRGEAARQMNDQAFGEATAVKNANPAVAAFSLGDAAHR